MSLLVATFAEIAIPIMVLIILVAMFGFLLN